MLVNKDSCNGNKRTSDKNRNVQKKKNCSQAQYK